MKQITDILRFAEFLSKFLVNSAEIVVHDVRAKKIIWIENGNITNRQVGTRDEASSIRLLYASAKKSSTPGMLIGYHSKSAGDRPLRSSNLFFEDDDGALVYALCINEDVSRYGAMQEICSIMLGDGKERELPDAAPQDADTIETLTMNVILSEIEKAKPFSLDSREAKLTILKRLNEKGVFEVRHSSERVCELLQIATPTLYKYLKEIKAGEEEA